ncbi:hypothetical protein EON67_02500 [archaeon]|nr:MAG: hypothetical protein EON67_02500 [archaeon]
MRIVFMGHPPFNAGCDGKRCKVDDVAPNVRCAHHVPSIIISARPAPTRVTSIAHMYSPT